MFAGRTRKWQDATDPWWKRHSLGIVLVALLVAQMAAYHFTLLPDWVAGQVAHGETVQVWPDYVVHYAQEWFVSILADTYGALLLVVLTKYFYEQGSQQAG